jgi:riboflavin kinase
MNLTHTLIELSRLLDSADSKLVLTTGKLGEILGTSQQTASRYLNSLEAEGYITKRIVKNGQEIKLTPKALEMLEDIQYDLKRFIESKHEFVVGGRIVSGMGEGAHYVRKYSKRIRDLTGYTPYPGTLNVYVEVKPDLSRYVTESVESFSEGGRTYGQLDLIPVELTYRKKNVKCHLIVPERTHHKNDLELISRNNLRRELGLLDESRVGVRIIH